MQRDDKTMTTVMSQKNPNDGNGSSDGGAMRQTAAAAGRTAAAAGQGVAQEHLVLLSLCKPPFVH